MFTDYSTEVIGFPSISHKPREVSNNECQTPARDIKEQEVQLKSFVSTESQTNPPTATTETSQQYDMTALAAFLSRVAPLVIEELEIVADFSDIEEGGPDEEPIVQRMEAMNAQAGIGKKVTSLSWSSTGGTLAVATSFTSHDSWCNHDGQIDVYNTVMEKIKLPRTINTNACITAVQFHPWEPSVLAAGLYNGEVIIKDLRKDDDWAAMESHVEHESHVVYLGWLGTVNEPLCVSAVADGRIFLRKYSQQSSAISVVQKFMVTNSHLNQKYHDRNEAVTISAVAAVDSDSCVVGVAEGGLYLARLSPITPLVTHPGYYDPVVQVYQRHRSAITSICKATSANEFATVSCDGELRVYIVSEVQPKYIIHTNGCPLDCFWTNTQTVIGVCGIKDEVKFVRITTGQILDTHLELSGSQEVATTASVNLRRNIVAIGDSSGKIELWRVVVSERSG